MNLQERSDKRSLALHRAVVKRLHENPELWEKSLQNIRRWMVREYLNLPSFDGLPAKQAMRQKLSELAAVGVYRGMR